MSDFPISSDFDLDNGDFVTTTSKFNDHYTLLI